MRELASDFSDNLFIGHIRFDGGLTNKEEDDGNYQGENGDAANPGTQVLYSIRDVQGPVKVT